MKPYLTLEEAKTILSLIKSQDEETVILGLYVLTTRSFKVTKLLRTCVDDAQSMLIEIKKEYPYKYKIRDYRMRISKSLYRYIYFKSKYICKDWAMQVIDPCVSYYKAAE